MMKPKTLVCGHSFCSQCINQLARGDILTRKCPIPRQALPSSIKELPVSVITKRMVDNLNVRCTLESCGWSGKVAKVKKHSNECNQKNIKCSFRCSFTAKRQTWYTMNRCVSLD